MVATTKGPVVTKSFGVRLPLEQVRFFHIHQSHTHILFRACLSQTNSFSKVFRVPTTHDVLTLFDPRYPKSHLDLINLALLGSQLVLFAWLSQRGAKLFFFFYFAFWRAAYDAGLGYVLTKQSKKKWIVREVQKRAWLDQDKRPRMRAWIKSQLQGKMGKDYSFDVCGPIF